MKNIHLFLDVFVFVVDTLAVIHLSGLRCNDVTHVDLGTRSGSHSNLPEIKAGLFTYYFTRFARFARFVSLFRVLVHALFNVYINSLSTAVTKSELIMYADDAVLVVATSTSQELTDALRHDFNQSKSPTGTSATN